ncbi:MAG: STAS domain-containing protein [Candidatus Tumulicola sp.]
MNDATPLIVYLAQPEYDVALCENLAKELEPSYTARSVIIDMSGVNYIDSTCLGKLVRMHSEREKRGFGAARLVLPSQQIRRLFKLVRFEALWPLYDSLDDALKDSADTVRRADVG